MQLTLILGSSKKWLVASTLAVGAVAAIGQSANAALTLTLSETGFAPLTFTDTTNSGGISYFGNYGVFQTNFVVGVSNKLTGTGGVGSLQIESINVVDTSGTAGTLVVTLTDDGYTTPGSLGATDALNSSVGGTFTSPKAGDSVKFQSFVTTPATTTGLQSYTAPATVVGTTSFNSAVGPVNFTQGTTYTLQNITQISLSGAGESTNVSGSTTVTGVVPEPASLSLLALGGLAALRRRKRMAC